MKHYFIIIVILLSVISLQGVLALPAESNTGLSLNLKNLPDVLRPGQTKFFDVVIQNSNDYMLYDIIPIIEITPQESLRSLNITADSIPLLEPMERKLTHVSISADPYLPIRNIHVYGYATVKDEGGIIMTGRVSDLINNVIKVEPASPLQQFKSGIAAKDIVCKEGLQLIKSDKNMPACVSPQTKQKLIQRGWNEYQNQSQKMEVTLKDGTKSFVSYDISNGLVRNLRPSIVDSSLVVEIESYGDGELDITIPRSLVDARLGVGESAQDDSFFVLVNGVEVDFKENTPTTEDRNLLIPFSKDTNIIEIIGSFPLHGCC